MDQPSFETLAERTLELLMSRIEERLQDRLEIDLAGAVLTIELDDGRTYVINSHVPNRQIWLSSPISGATHFAYDAPSATWRSTRGDATLKALLAAELGAATGTDIAFD